MESNIMNLLDRLDKLCTILENNNHNMDIETDMLQCPTCTQQKSKFNSSHTYKMSFNNNTGEVKTEETTLYDSILSHHSKIIFGTAMLNKCTKCKEEYYLCCYYENSTCKSLVFSKEDFYKLIVDYYISSDLGSYLPTQELKRTYSDARININNFGLSNEGKMGSIRPLLEAFLNERNNVTENNDIRKAIKELSDKEIESQLHKITDDTLKGLHVKNIPLKNNPSEVLIFLETLFTKLYKLPKEEKKLEQEFKDKKTLIENSFNIKLESIQK